MDPGRRRLPRRPVYRQRFDDMLCKIWNAATGELVHTLAGHQPVTPHQLSLDAVTPARFLSDARFWRRPTGGARRRLGRGFRAATGRRRDAPHVHVGSQARRHSIGGVRSVAFSADGRLLAIGGTGQINNIDHLEALARIEIFDWQANERKIEHAGDKHKGAGRRMEFSPAGDWIVSAGGDHEGSSSSCRWRTAKFRPGKGPHAYPRFRAERGARYALRLGPRQARPLRVQGPAAPVPRTPALPVEGA